MARGSSRQTGLLDVDLSDDEELVRIVEEVFESENVTDRNRAGKKRIRAILLERHPDAINAHRTGQNSGYVRVNGIRFLAKNSTREAETKEIKVSEGKAWQPFKFEAAK